MEAVETETEEVQTTSGVVQDVRPHGKTYGIKVDGEWYGGFGECRVMRGDVPVIEYTMNGKYRDIQRIRPIGEAVAESRLNVSGKASSASASKETVGGWQQVTISADEEETIQSHLGKKNADIVEESIEMAREILINCGIHDALTAENVVRLATLMAERRIVHVSRVYDDYVRAKAAAMRGPPAGTRR